MKTNISPAVMPDGTVYYKQEEVADVINEFFKKVGRGGVEVTADNGNVLIKISGNKDSVIEATQMMIDAIPGFAPGDGKKIGEVIIDGYEAGIYGDTVSVGVFGQSGFIKKENE